MPLAKPASSVMGCFELKRPQKSRPPPPMNKRDHDDDDDDDADEEPELTDTVFIRNLARFDTTQESLKEYIEKNFGEAVYCLICKDKETGESKGTAFVKFKSVESAERCLNEYEDPEHQTKFFLDGRNLFVLPALTRDKINEVKRAVAPQPGGEESGGGAKKKKKPRHNRAKPVPQSAESSNPSTPSRPHKKFQCSIKKKHAPASKNSVNNSNSNENKNKNKNKSHRKPPKAHQSGGKKTKPKNTNPDKKKTFAKKANQKPKGRQSR